MQEIQFKMPCQLLKCLEDRHNWDKASVVKNNLRRFFETLLIGELDIAVATSIEKYHAKWVGASCADICKRPIPDYRPDETLNWEDRAVAFKAHKMAVGIAEEMFKSKVDQIMQTAKEIIAKGPPACECVHGGKGSGQDLAVYHCQIEQRIARTVKEYPKKSKARAGKASTSFTDSPATATDSPVTESPEYSGQASFEPSLELPQTYANLDNVQDIKPHLMKTNNSNKSRSKKMAKSHKRSQDVSPSSKKRSNDGSISPQRVGRNIIAGRGSVIQDFWKRTQKDVSLLRDQIEGLKKTIITREDLKNVLVEKKITKSVQGSVNPNSKIVSNEKNNADCRDNLQTKTSKQHIVAEKPHHSKEPYAVNPCFCGKHRGKTNQLKQAYDSTNGEIVKGISSKVLDSDLLYDKEKPFEKVLTSELPPEKNPTCGSSCACFNKFPSDTSIDKLLATLNKWHTDLNNLSVGETITDSQDIEALMSRSKKEIGKNISHKMYDPSKLLCYSDITNLSTMKEKNSNRSEFPLQDSTRQMPGVDSVYIAAVNLEKSNENFYNNVINSGNTQSYENKLELDNKCADACTCPIKTQGENKETNKKDSKNGDDSSFMKSKVLMSHINQQTEDNLNYLSSENVLSKNILERQTDKRKFKIIPFPSDLDSTKEHDIDSENLNPCACGHQIKLLGVTLANAKSANNQETIDNKTMKHANMKTQAQLSSNHSENRNIKTLPKFEITNAERINAELIECETDTLDKIKAYLSGNINPFIKDQSGRTIADTNSVLRSNQLTDREANHDEKCVCCTEIQNLEFNTFELLEEHLKKKLDELKSEYTHSYFKPNEERKILSNLVKKIQYTIKDITSKVKCDCSGEDVGQDSWQRAFNLLKEYLRVKISRVECSCSTTANDDNQYILSNLVEKICHLIEKDFQRIKDICKCSNKEENHMTLHQSNTGSKIPEALKRSQTCLNSSAQVGPDFNTRSVQFIPNLDNKCCETKGNENLKTVETQNSVTERRIFKTASLFCDLLNSAIPFVTQSTQYSSKSSTDDMKLVDSKIIKSPLIGATLDCNNNLSNCTCPKSKAREANAKVDEILKKCYDNCSDLSYIMSKTNSYANSTEAIAFDELPIIQECEQNSFGTIVTKNMIDELGNLSLKDSVEHFKDSLQQRDETNTLMKSITSFKSPDHLANADHDSRHSWYDSNSQPQFQDDMARKKCVHFPEFEPISRAWSETNAKRSDKVSAEKRCSCDTVPICHVKMLVDSIESKLINSECTCDSLGASVCPVHSYGRIDPYHV